MTEPEQQPRHPFWKDEWVTKHLSAQRAVAFFVGSMVLAVLVFVGAGLFLVHEINDINRLRAVYHNQSVTDRANLHDELDNLKKSRTSLQKQIDQAVCMILDVRSSDSPDLTRKLRSQHHCTGVPASR